MEKDKTKCIITTIITLLILFGIGWYYYSHINSHINRIVYTIEKESYPGSGVRQDKYSVESYNHPFKDLNSCLKQANMLNKRALEEYRIKMDYGDKYKSEIYRQLEEMYGSDGPPKAPSKYGCIMYKESDFKDTYDDTVIYGTKKYEKLFPN